MECVRCGASNRPGRKFCAACGAALVAPCPACGADNDAGDRFCGGCGRALVVAPATAGTLRAYTPKHLAERILTSRAALEGERKLVTVLFCDVVESTRLAERLDPEAMHELMDRVLRLMADAVHRYEGTVNQFLGDGVMALFGAPVAVEDHALRAVQAALAIRETVAGLSEELRRDRNVEIRLRIGVNTGHVVVGKIGDDFRMDYTAIGETTNLAARLQAHAEPGAIMVGEATHRLVEGYVRSEALGPIELRGLSERVRAHRVIGRRRRTRLEVSEDRGLAGLVGRARELSVLREAFERARHGRGQVVGVVGEPGVGKSRLLHELRRSLDGERATVLIGQCVVYAQSTPYAPILEILRSNFHVEDDDNPLQIDAKLRGGVRDLDASLATVVPFLRELLLPEADESVKTLDGKTKRQKTFEAIRALTIAGSERAPLVLLIEDLHWIDRTSEDYLDFLVDSLAGFRILLATTHRPGYAVRWADKPYYTQLALDVLSESETSSVVRGILGADAVPDDLVRRVHDKAEGNPLFVEEITRALVERGAVVREGAVVRWASAAAVDFPERGQDIIRARIDRLDEPVKRTAQVAAVIGREFRERLLAEVVETAAALEECLGTLKDAELVREKRFFPELEYIFKHAIIQDVAYQSILTRRRRDLHRAIGRAIESLYAERLADHYEVLAHHFVEAEEWDAARDYLVKAGDKAASVYANADAVSLYERALPLLGPDDPKRRADVLHKLGFLCFTVVDFERSRGHGEEALALYRALGDKAGIVAAHMLLVAVYASTAWDGALEDQALPHAEALAHITENDPDTVQKGMVYQRIAHLYLHRSQANTALGWTRRAVECYARLGVTMGTALGTALAYTGQVDDGTAYSEANWDGVLKAGIPMIASVFGHEICLVFSLLRDPRRAREWGERALPEALKGNSPILEVTVRRPLLLTSTLSGDSRRAEQEQSRVVAIEATTLGGCPWEDVASLALLDLRCGRARDARDYLNRMLPVWEGRQQVAGISGCSLMLAACDVEAGDYAAAERHATRSLAICRAGGNVLFELWVLPLLVEMYLATDRISDAAECVTRGFALLTPGQDWRGLPAPMYLARANLGVARRRWDEVERDFDAALAVNRRYGLPFDEAKTLAAWARLDLARGGAADRDRGRERLGAAVAMFERADAAGEADRTRAALDRVRA